MSDPRQVRREDGGRLRLLSNGALAIFIQAFPAHSALPQAAEDVPADLEGWVILTNGAEWKIFNHRFPKKAFRTISLSDARSAESALATLAMLGRSSFRKQDLDAAFISEEIDADVARALVQHLDGSKELVAAIRERLVAHDIQIRDEDILGALSRLPVTIDDAEALKAAASPSLMAPSPASGDATARPVGPKAPSPRKKKPQGSRKAPAETKPKKQPKAADAPSEDQVAEIPTNLDEVAWPQGASYAMHRKKTIAFIRFRPKTGEAVLLPSSFITPGVGKSLTKQQASLREECLQDGRLANAGSMLQVVKPITFSHPRLAATFAAGTMVKDMTAWVSKAGRPLTEQLSAPPSNRSEEPPAVSQVETPPASTSDESDAAPETSPEAAE